MRAKEIIPASRPRNFVAKNQQTGGAGAHRDKKKEQKQGYEKHKGKDVAEDKAGWSDNSGTVKKYEPTKKGPMPSWRLNPDGTATDKNTGITYNRDGSVVKKEEGSEMEGRRDYGYDDFGNSLRPGDDEGSTEPPNNFAIYINGKKWKVFQGKGQYADDQYEMQQFRQLQAMAQRKSQETGKKWEVARTGEPATK